MGKGTLKVSLPANNDSDIGEKGKVEYGKYTGDEEQLVNNGYHCNSGQVMKKGSCSLRTVVECIVVAVAIITIIGLTVALIITKQQLDKSKNIYKTEVYVKNTPIRTEISDKTLQRASDFTSYGQQHQPMNQDPYQDGRPPYHWP